MSKKNKHKNLLDNLEFTFDETLADLRESDEKGKFSKKHEIATRTLLQMIRRVQDDLKPKDKKPLAW